MEINNKKYKHVKSISECANDIKDFAIPESKKKDFWRKPTSKVLSFDEYAKTPLGDVQEGSSHDTSNEKVLSTAPLGDNAQILWSDGCRDKIFLLRLINHESTERGDHINHEIGCSPIASIKIPEGVLSNGVLSRKSLQVFTFNFIELLRADISNTNLKALDFVREWTKNSGQGEQFIKMALGSKDKKKVISEMFEEFKELIHDEKAFKEMFPDVPTFSEWKANQGDSDLDAKLREMGVNPKDMGEA